MDKTTQNLSAAALLILGCYTLIIGGVVSVPHYTDVIVGLFWTEFVLIVAMLFRIPQSPMAVLPAVFATLCIVGPSAPLVFTATVKLVKHLIH